MRLILKRNFCFDVTKGLDQRDVSPCTVLTCPSVMLTLGVFQVIDDLLDLLFDPLLVLFRLQLQLQAGDHGLPVEALDQRRHLASLPALPKVPKRKRVSVQN